MVTANKGAPDLGDDPNLVDAAYARLKKCFATGKTRPYAYRVL